jgi:hypothetical protein
MTWDDILRQSLLMLDFGVMLFEKVYGTYEFEGKTYVTLKKLAPRLPRSVLMWELADRTFGIRYPQSDFDKKLECPILVLEEQFALHSTLAFDSFGGLHMRRSSPQQEAIPFLNRSSAPNAARRYYRASRHDQTLSALHDTSIAHALHEHDIHVLLITLLIY